MTIKSSKQIPTKSEVKKWLMSQGYPFEMRVSRELQKAGWTTDQGDFYRDEEGNIEKEIDVIADYTPISEDDYSFTVKLVVECKYNKDKPTIIMGGTSLKKSFNKISYLFHKDSYWLFGFNSLFDYNHENILDGMGPTGYAAISAFKKQNGSEDERDPTYSALNQVCRASNYYAKRKDWRKQYSVIVPIICVNGPIYHAKSNSAKLSLTQISCGGIVWSKMISGTKSHLIHFHTIKSISEFSAKIKLLIDNNIDSIREGCRSAMVS